jgi:hypothetical protein
VPATVAVPGAIPVKLTEQLPDTSVQLAPTVKTAVLDETKLTVPVGVFDGFVVSVTVAVQVDVPPMIIVAGLQATAVEVLSFKARTPAVANAFGSDTPATVAPTSAVSGTTAAPLVIRIQSFVPVTLPPEHPELTRISMAAGVVESTL